MHTPQPMNEPVKVRPLTDEADIGSGEKTPGQLETEEIIADIPALPSDGHDERALPAANLSENMAVPSKDQ